jgi:hypothetical protein
VDQKEYFNYLLQLGNEEAKENPVEDDLFGYFEFFRPEGKGLEKVFAPVPMGEAYLQRMSQVYEATKNDDPHRAYFVVGHPITLSKNDLIKIGTELLNNLKLFASEIAGQELTHKTKRIYVESAEMVEVIGKINKVKILEDQPLDFEKDEYYCVTETLSDWIGEHSEPDELIDCLGEAYYSIACDYWIRYYLEWPRFQHLISKDIFEPYFKLWKSGLRFSIYDDVLVIGNQTQE